MTGSAIKLSIIAGTLAAFSASASAETVTVLGGGLKGGAYAMAVGLSKLLKDKAGMNAQPQTSGGMVAQARLLDKGRAQFAFGIGGPIGAWAYHDGPGQDALALFDRLAGLVEVQRVDAAVAV